MSTRPLRGAGRLLSAALVAALGCAAPVPEQSTTELARISEGIAFFEARAASDPVDNIARRQLINRYGERFALGADFDDVARAEALARQVLVGSPAPARDHARLAAVLLMQHRFAESLQAANAAFEADAGSPEALGARFDAALAVGHYADALATLRQLPPREVATEARWVGWHLVAGNTAAARATQERVCQALDRAAAPPVTRAWCLTELGRQAAEPAAAARIFGAALALLPGYRGALEGLASLALEAGRHAEAAALYRDILSGAHPDLYRRLAEAERGLGNAAEATRLEQEFRRMVSGSAQEALQAPEIVAALLDEGPPAHDEALAVALREVERRPTLESWALLAEVHQARGEVASAGAASRAIDSIRATIRVAAGAPAS